MVNPNHITPYGEIPEEERELADDLVFNRREDALERFIEHFESKGAARRRPSRPNPTEGMEPEEALHFHILRRKQDGVEDWIDASVEKIGAVPTLNDGAAARDEGGRRQVRRRRADPAVRAPVGRGHEARGRAAREVPRQGRGLHEGHGRDRDRVRRRARHRQVARQHDPHQQRLHGRRPRQAGADLDDRRRRRRSTTRPRSACRALLVSTSKQMPLCIQELHQRGARVPGADRRRRDQPRLRPARPVPQRPRSDEIYEPGVFYCKDAFEGLAKMDQLVDDEARAGARGQDPRARPSSCARSGRRTTTRCRPTTTACARRRRPTSRCPSRRSGACARSRSTSTRSIPHLDTHVLFKLHWGGRGVKGEAWGKLLREDFLPRLRAHVARAGLPAPARPARLLPVLLRGQRAGRAGSRGPASASSSGSSSRASPGTTASAWPTSTGRSAPASSTSSPSRPSPPATRSPS